MDMMEGKTNSKHIGRLTGKDILAGKTVRVVEGFQVFDDYFTDSDEASDESPFQSIFGDSELAESDTPAQKRGNKGEPPQPSKKTQNKSMQPMSSFSINESTLSLPKSTGNKHNNSNNKARVHTRRGFSHLVNSCEKNPSNNETVQIEDAAGTDKINEIATGNTGHDGADEKEDGEEKDKDVEKEDEKEDDKGETNNDDIQHGDKVKSGKNDLASEITEEDTLESVSKKSDLSSQIPEASIQESASKKNEASIQESASKKSEASIQESASKKSEASIQESASKKSEASIQESASKKSEASIQESASKKSEASIQESASKQNVASIQESVSKKHDLSSHMTVGSTPESVSQLTTHTLTNATLSQSIASQSAVSNEASAALNIDGDPLGSISRTDGPAKAQLQPSSAVSNFRTRKRLTYSETGEELKNKVLKKSQNLRSKSASSLECTDFTVTSEKEFREPNAPPPRRSGRITKRNKDPSSQSAASDSDSVSSELPPRPTRGRSRNKGATVDARATSSKTESQFQSQVETELASSQEETNTDWESGQREAVYEETNTKNIKEVQEDKEPEKPKKKKKSSHRKSRHAIETLLPEGADETGEWTIFQKKTCANKERCVNDKLSQMKGVTSEAQVKNACEEIQEEEIGKEKHRLLTSQEDDGNSNISDIPLKPRRTRQGTKKTNETCANKERCVNDKLSQMKGVTSEAQVENACEEIQEEEIGKEKHRLLTSQENDGNSNISDIPLKPRRTRQGTKKTNETCANKERCVNDKLSQMKGVTSEAQVENACEEIQEEEIGKEKHRLLTSQEDDGNSNISDIPLKPRRTRQGTKKTNEEMTSKQQAAKISKNRERKSVEESEPEPKEPRPSRKRSKKAEVLEPRRTSRNSRKKKREEEKAENEKEADRILDTNHINGENGTENYEIELDIVDKNNIPQITENADQGKNISGIINEEACNDVFHDKEVSCDTSELVELKNHENLSSSLENIRKNSPSSKLKNTIVPNQRKGISKKEHLEKLKQKLLIFEDPELNDFSSEKDTTLYDSYSDKHRQLPANDTYANVQLDSTSSKDRQLPESEKDSNAQLNSSPNELAHVSSENLSCNNYASKNEYGEDDDDFEIVEDYPKKIFGNSSFSQSPRKSVGKVSHGSKGKGRSRGSSKSSQSEDENEEPVGKNAKGRTNKLRKQKQLVEQSSDNELVLKTNDKISEGLEAQAQEPKGQPKRDKRKGKKKSSSEEEPSPKQPRNKQKNADEKNDEISEVLTANQPKERPKRDKRKVRKKSSSEDEPSPKQPRTKQDNAEQSRKYSTSMREEDNVYDPEIVEGQRDCLLADSMMPTPPTVTKRSGKVAKRHLPLPLLSSTMREESGGSKKKKSSLAAFVMDEDDDGTDVEQASEFNDIEEDMIDEECVSDDSEAVHDPHPASFVSSKDANKTKQDRANSTSPKKPRNLRNESQKTPSKNATKFMREKDESSPMRATYRQTPILKKSGAARYGEGVMTPNRRKSVTFAARTSPPSAETPGSAMKKRLSMGTPGPASMTDSPIHFNEVTASQTPQITARKECKIILPSASSPEEGLRKSKRVRVKTLDWFRGEHIIYEKRKSGIGLKIVGIKEALEDKIGAKTRKKFKPKVRRKRNIPGTPRNLSIHDPERRELDVHQAQDQSILVVNPETREEVSMDCMIPQDTLSFRGPLGSPATDQDPIILCKAIQQKAFSAGQLILRPLEEKGKQLARNDSMIFSIIRGKVSVTIHESISIMESGDMFFVPRGNVYNIENLRADEAKLVFFQHKG